MERIRECIRGFLFQVPAFGMFGQFGCIDFIGLVKCKCGTGQRMMGIAAFFLFDIAGYGGIVLVVTVIQKLVERWLDYRENRPRNYGGEKEAAK